jgi:hypothetical protein
MRTFCSFRLLNIKDTRSLDMSGAPDVSPESESPCESPRESPCSEVPAITALYAELHASLDERIQVAVDKCLAVMYDELHASLEKKIHAAVDKRVREVYAQLRADLQVPIDGLDERMARAHGSLFATQEDLEHQMQDAHHLTQEMQSQIRDVQQAFIVCEEKCDALVRTKPAARKWSLFAPTDGVSFGSLVPDADSPVSPARKWSLFPQAVGEATGSPVSPALAAPYLR